MDYQLSTLNNGLRIIHLPSNSDVVYCGYAINAGTRHEKDGEEGLAHFCEHMTFKGTEKRSSLQIINTLERVGGELNAYTAKEETVYYAAVLRQHFRRAVDLLTDIVFHSTYPQQEISKEVEVVCDEIDSYRDSPTDLIYDEFENVLFSKMEQNGTAAVHGLGHNVLGTKESVHSFTTDDCLRFTRREYKPERMVFYVHGNIDFKQLVSWLEGMVEVRESGLEVRESGLEVRESGLEVREERLEVLSVASLGESVSTSRAREEGLEVREERLEMRDEEVREYHQAHVMLGTAFNKDTERWRMPLYIINNILGGPSMNSRFNLSLRERRGLVYTVESMMTTYTDTLMWSVYFGSDKNDANRCLRLVKSELQRLRRKPMTTAALNAAKKQLKGQIALASENRESFAIDMAKQYLHRRTLRSNERLFSSIDAVTPEDIHTLANTILAEDNLESLRF